MMRGSAPFRGSGLALLLTSALLSCRTPEGSPSLDRGLVASAEPHASQVGAEILARGGNAVDAAIAVQFALAVTFPNAGNLGGGGFMLVHLQGREAAIDYRETAPAAARRDMFLDETGTFVASRALGSPLASGVPGSVAGMWLAHRRFGTLPWKDLLAPATRLAEEGWTIDPQSARSFASLSKNNAAQYFHGRSGERLVQPELAATLRRIALSGRDGFYTGETARLVVEEMRRTGGLITMEDLERYEPVLRTPLEGSYRGLRVVSMPPPSSGGVALLQLLGMTARFDPASLGFHSPAHVHTACEIEKRVFADRSVHLGDPDFNEVPVERLLDPEYLRARAGEIAPGRKTDPGTVTAGTFAREHEETTHFSIVDRWGNAVSNTTTLNDSFGSGIVVPGAGFLLNNEMDDFSPKPGVPNLFGVIGGEANAIAPGKRMLSSMCPTFVFRGDRLWLVLGTPGGPTIFTTVFQVLVNRIDFGMTLTQAVEAPRFHHQWPALQGIDPISVERPFGPPTDGALGSLGYTIRPRGRIGDVQAIEISGDRAVGASDPRGIGVAVPE